MPHTPQALVFPPLQRAVPSTARAAEAEQFEHAAESIRPSWPALSKPSAAGATAVRGGAQVSAFPLPPSPFDLHRNGAEAAPSFAPRSFDVGELDENPFKRPGKRRGWLAAVLVIGAAALGWALLRGPAPSAAPTAEPTPSAPAPSAPAASAPAAPEPSAAPTPPSAAAPRAEPSAAPATQPAVAAPIKPAPAPAKAVRSPLQAKQPAPVVPAKSAAKPQPKPAARPVTPQRAAPMQRSAPAQPLSDSFAPRRTASEAIQTNPYD